MNSNTLKKDKKFEDIIIEKKVSSQNSNFTDDQLQEISQIFQFFMNPKSKLLNLKDLVTSLKTLGYLETHPILSSIITRIDKKYVNSDIDYPTFLNEICDILVILDRFIIYIEILKGDPKEEKGKKAIFDLIDKNKNEKITFDDLKKICVEIGVKISDDELKEIFLEIARKKPNFAFEDFDEYLDRQYGFK